MSVHRVTSPPHKKHHKTKVPPILWVLIIALILTATTTQKRQNDAFIDSQQQDINFLMSELEAEKERSDVYYNQIIEQQETIKELTNQVRQMKPDVTPKANEIILLEKLVTAEAVGEGYEGMLAVANVVINRVESESFPDTITDVINQQNQFCPVRTGSIHSVTPDDTARKAVDDALKGHRVVENALYFYNPSVVSRGHWIRSRETVGEIGNHRFAM